MDSRDFTKKLQSTKALALDWDASLKSTFCKDLSSRRANRPNPSRSRSLAGQKDVAPSCTVAYLPSLSSCKPQARDRLFFFLIIHVFFGLWGVRTRLVAFFLSFFGDLGWLGAFFFFRSQDGLVFKVFRWLRWPGEVPVPFVRAL